jgi:hypothetical protein
MKTIKLPENFYSILGAMWINDKFWLPTGEEFKLVVINSLPPKFGVKILTFESNGKDYMCNVWNGQDVFYLQEM